MDDPKAKFIEAAVRRLSDNAEQRAAARSLLEITVTGSSTCCEEVVARWNAVDSKKGRFTWKKLLYVCLCGASLMVVNFVWMSLNYSRKTSSIGGSHYMDFFHWGSRITDEEVARNLSPDETRLLFGDLSKISYSERMKSLWDREPDNPVYFSAYVDACLSEHEKLPPDFLATARRLDPDNAWFTYLAAGERAKGAVKARKQSEAEIVANVPLEWDILDETAFNESLALFRESHSQSRCDSYFGRFGRRQIGLLPVGTPTEIVFTNGFFTGKYYRSFDGLVRISNVMVAGLWRCGETGDVNSFLRLWNDSQNFFRKIDGAEVESIFGEFTNTGVSLGIVRGAFPAACKLGLDDVGGKLRPTVEMVHQRHARHRLLMRLVNTDRLWDHGGELAFNCTSMATQKLKHSPRVTMAELEPGRLMDHETISWTGCHLVWAIMVAGLGLAAAFRLRHPVLVRRLAARMETLVSPRDWMWIIGTGVVLPLLYFLAVTRLTPLGGRDFSILASNVETFYFDDPPLGYVQWVALGPLILLSSGAALSACLKRRCWPLGQVGGKTIFWILPLFCSAAFIPASGWVVWDYSAFVAMTAWILAGIALLWIVLIMILGLFSNYQSQLSHGIFARLLMVLCACAALVVISATPVFKAMAFHWSGKDTLVLMDKDFPTGTEFEHRVALQYREETREMMGDLLK